MESVPRLVEVKLPAARGGAVEADRIEIELHSGRRLSVPEGMSLERLSALVKLLEGRRCWVATLSVRLFVATELVDGRKVPDSLMVLVRDVLRHDIFEGHLFISKKPWLHEIMR